MAEYGLGVSASIPRTEIEQAAGSLIQFRPDILSYEGARLRVERDFIPVYNRLVELAYDGGSYIPRFPEVAYRLEPHSPETLRDLLATLHRIRATDFFFTMEGLDALLEDADDATERDFLREFETKDTVGNRYEDLTILTDIHERGRDEIPIALLPPRIRRYAKGQAGIGGMGSYWRDGHHVHSDNSPRTP